MGGPVVEVAPRFGVVLGEGVVEGRGAGLSGGGKGVSGFQPLLVQLLEPVEGGVQNTQLVDQRLCTVPSGRRPSCVSAVASR
ncbi:hypothetical protein QFZ56_006093 [Streptomyces achromogenes]|uniref:Uncharacterized protein n=1 Tax=Streptomyces achromogenes TaxID=67255 RepID=A0ABU0Q8Y9_STRAH|nr:hypothetical protein [Streptomyces achromogenes]